MSPTFSSTYTIANVYLFNIETDVCDNSHIGSTTPVTVFVRSIVSTRLESDTFGPLDVPADK